MAVAELCTACGSSLRADDRFCPRCGTDQSGAEQAVYTTALEWQALFPRLVRAAAPRYRVLRLLGQGGMAAVYLAEEPRLARRVAIKVMSPGLLSDAVMLARFEQEARTTAQLRHPNIVAVHHFDEGEGLYYFVLEYVAGRTLAQIFRDVRTSLPFAAVAHWLAQAAGALAHAHRFGVVHRDIKPANIMIDADGNALLTDFGIAKVADEAGFTRTGMLIGTPSYMSPEQCMPGSELSGASDQYSLGVVAYELLTGAPPFSGAPVTVVHAHLHVAPEPIRARRPECPEDLALVVERMLAKDPQARFPGMLALLAEPAVQQLGLEDPLRSWLAGIATPLTLKVSPSSLAFDALGDTESLRPELLDWTDAPLDTPQVSWSAAPAGVVAVDETGAVTSLCAGSAEIIAECRGARTVIPVEVRPKPVSVVVEPSQHHFSCVGQSAQVAVWVVDRNGNRLAERIVWKSRRPEVATVDSDGSVHAIGNGTATLVASAAGLSASMRVSVSDRPSRIRIDPVNVMLTAVGEVLQLRAEVFDSAGEVRSEWIPGWTVADPTVVTVDQDGLVTARSEGTTVVTAHIDELSASATATVEHQCAAIELTPERIVLSALNDAFVFTAAVVDSHGTTLPLPVQWMTSEPAIATIDNAGCVVARAEGEARITAQHGQLSAHATVLVRQQPVSMRVSPDKVVLHSLGTRVPLTVMLHDSRGNEVARPWTCTSNTPTVVRTEADGSIVAVAPGRTQVHVACGSLRATISVDVQPRIASLWISPNEIVARALGEQTRLSAFARDAGGSPVVAPRLAWSSSDPRIATVDSSGCVTGIAPGKATIRARAADVVAEVSIEVDPAIFSLEIEPASILLDSIGARAVLQVIAADEQGAAVGCVPLFRSTDPAVFTVDELGRVLATGNGSAECEVSVGEHTARTPVVVRQDVTRILCRPRRLRFRALSERQAVVADCFDAGGHPVDCRVQWRTSDSRVALVDPGGLVAAVGDGSAVITARAGNCEFHVEVNVERLPAQLRFFQDDVELDVVGECQELGVIVLDAAGSALPSPIQWTSSDDGIATVDDTGRVTAISKGEVRITARAAAAAATLVVRVTSGVNSAPGAVASATPAEPSGRDAISDRYRATLRMPFPVLRYLAVSAAIVALVAVGVLAMTIAAPRRAPQTLTQIPTAPPASDTPQNVGSDASPRPEVTPDAVQPSPARPQEHASVQEAEIGGRRPEPSRSRPGESGSTGSPELPDPHVDPESANKAVADFLSQVMNSLRDGRMPPAAQFSGLGQTDATAVLNARSTTEMTWQFVLLPAFRTRDRAEATISVQLGPNAAGFRPPPERLRALVVRTPEGLKLEQLRP